jgi:hypothetical protein
MAFLVTKAGHNVVEERLSDNIPHHVTIITQEASELATEDQRQSTVCLDF